ncbi:glycosyltransferase [Neptuniibacter sp. 2_MG-2023]|uniref:glycosyltransferase n=1 Tax=Neptuniibacter sp. 2_MG-2023 TaxID=3062671 RepID=UPI0026E18632|nr:glycosyltransferase [Neptuniibacter sp. 2_MG-2023]MDO6515537.1 glycosyltransferase [Neptuniibacter sp. 2_MG-2023]
MNSIKKISLIMPSFRGGGAERVFIDLADGFVNAGYIVDLVVLSDDGPYREFVNKKIKVVCLSGESASRSFFKLKKYIKICNSTTIISCLTHLNIIVLLSSAFSRFKGQVIVTEHNHYSLEKENLPPIKSFFLKVCARLLYPIADHVVAVSQGVADDLSAHLKLDSNRVEVIYNPIDFERISSLSKCIPENITPFMSELLSRRYFIGIGRLVKQKRYDLMITAFREVHRYDSDVFLVILGDGPLESELRQLIEDSKLENCVYLLGFLDNPFYLLSSANALVLSSDFEGFGNVIAEALVLGTPVVSTNCPSGPSEILADGKFGILVESGEINELAEAMFETLQVSKLEKYELIERGKKFDKSSAVSKYEKLCRG